MVSKGELEPVVARKMWRTLEPYHGMIYFTPRAADAYAALGVEGRTGYFASRVSPMGTVPASVVIATFFNFHPGLVEHAMEGVWSTTTPEVLLAARFDAADRMLRDALDEQTRRSDEMREARDLAAVAAEACSPEGRPLHAATAAVTPPDLGAHVELWHWITVLREYRGDGHLAALVLEGLDGVEALITHAASGDIPRVMLQSTRSWSDDEWDAGVDRLRGRGLIEAGTEDFTDAGRAMRDRIEATTDVLALRPWNALGAEGCDRLRSLVRPWSKAIVSGGAFGLTD